MRARLVVALVAGLLAVPLAGTSYAGWTATGLDTHASARAHTLLPATGLGAVSGCRLLVAGPQITLTWTASLSGFTSGYDVLRATTTGGPYAPVGSVPGASTTFEDTTVVGLNTTYYYVVRARHLAWTSVNSNQAGASTPPLCL